jgi:C4-dicarboxylate-specific signal transduction histidine kinase
MPNRARAVTRADPPPLVRMVTASIAHEVSQPLSGIMTNASTCLRVLSADSPDLQAARDTALRTLRDVDRAVAVLARLQLLFGTGRALTERVDADDLVREALALCRADLQAHGVRTSMEIEPGLPSIRGDAIQLQQVLLNLIRNACEAMAPVNDRARTLVIRARRDSSERVGIHVKDSGIGFGDRDVAKAFAPFYTTKRTGMGIGLCVSRSMVERQGGRLSASRNTDGPGTTFFLSMPCAA